MGLTARNTSAPIVSVVMPMRNAKDFVAQAIDSILQQTGVELEIVVVDDGSTDGSGEVVKSIDDARVRLIEGPGRGVAASFNAGLAVAEGAFMARCDADDAFSPGRLEAQLNWLQQHPEFGAICGGFATIAQKGEFIRNLDCGAQAAEITDELRSGRTRTSLCTWLVRTRDVRMAGGCREFFQTAEDIDLQFRLAERMRVWFDPSQSYLYRLHDASTTHSQSRTLRHFFDRTARQLQQQRLRHSADDLQRGRPPHVPDDDLSVVDSSRDHIQGMLLGAAWNEHAAGRRVKALRTALRACFVNPLRLRAWRSLGALAVRGSGG